MDSTRAFAVSTAGVLACQRVNPLLETSECHAGDRKSRPHAGLAEERFQRASPRIVPQLEQRLLLDLAHSLARDLEQSPDVLERHRVRAIEAEIEAQDFGFALLQRGE